MGRGVLVAVALAAVGVATAVGLDRRAGRRSPDTAGADRVAESGRVLGRVTRAGLPAAARVDAVFVSRCEGFGPVRVARPRPEEWLRAPVPAAARRCVARAGDDGRFEADLPVGTWSLVAVAPDGAMGGALCEVRQSGVRLETAIELFRGSESLRARFVHADGRPFVGLVTVEASSRTAAFPPTPLAEPRATDAEGRIVVESLPAGPVLLTPIEPGVFRGRAATVDLPAKAEATIVVDEGFTTFSGHVVADAGGVPLAGARVVLTFTEAENALSVGAVSDGGGVFRLSAPPAPGRLFVRADGFGPETQRVRAGQRGASVRLRRPSRVAGRVLDEGGTAVGGVLVYATRSDDLLEGVATTSDERGEFVLEGAPAGEIGVGAFGGGWASPAFLMLPDRGARALQAPDGGVLTVDRVVVPLPRVRGVVVDAGGAPVSGALVRATAGSRTVGMAAVGLPRGVGTAEAVTDVAGVVTLDTLVPGFDYEVEASVAGYGVGFTGPLTPGPPEGASFRIELPPPRRLDVTVVEKETGAPAAGAFVGVSRVYPPESGRGTLGPDVAATVVGPDGTARLERLPAGKLSVWASRFPRFVFSNAARSDVEGSLEGGVALSARLEVRATSSISGIVVRPDGTPAVGASVFVDGRDATTGARGDFVLRGVTAGTRRVSARLDDVEGILEAAGPAEPGVTDLRLAMLPRRVSIADPADFASAGSGPPLVVRLVGEGGEAVASAKGLLRRGSASEGFAFDGGVTRLYGVPRSAVLEVWEARGADGSLLPLGAVTTSLDRTEGELVLHIPPEWRIVGRVTAPDRRGAEGVEIRAVPDEPDRPNPLPHAVTRSGADGSYSLGNLSDRRYRLEVAAEDWLPIRVTRVAGGTGNVEIPVRPAVVARVTVLDPDGRPLRRVRVRTIPKRPTQGAAPAGGGVIVSGPQVQGATAEVTDALGIARLRGLAADSTHHLVVSPAPREDVLGTEIREWTPADTTVRLDRALAVAGTVVDSEGRPVPGIRVAGRTRTGGSTAVADEAGKFRIPTLPAGPVDLSIDVQGDSRPRAPPVQVEAGTQDVVLRVDLATVLSLRTEADPDAEPSARRSVLVEVAREREPASTTRSDQHDLGVVRFAGLDVDGTYVAFAHTLDGGFAAYERGLRVGPTVHPLRLVRSRSIAGHVRGPSGASAIGVMATGPALRQHGRVENDGTFRIQGLPEGTWTVEATARLGRERWAASASVATGGDVELTLEKK